MISSIDELIQKMVSGDKRALGKIITLMERILLPLPILSLKFTLLLERHIFWALLALLALAKVAL